MTLKDRIRAQIRLDGPIPISVYMQLALHDRRQGYYSTRPGLMTDFATAPEISQVFGELIGLWAVHEWRNMGAPAAFNLIEIGPGRGVLMDDAFRVASKATDFMQALSLHLIEPSPALQRRQADRLSRYRPQFHTELSEAPVGPSIIIANEWLDCLPVRQFVNSPEGWRERVVGLDAAGQLAFGLSPVIDSLPTKPPKDADQFEYSPALEAIVDVLAARLNAAPGRTLLIDYGPDNEPPGDTLRSYHDGAQVDPLTRPGEADITADVDFAALASHARNHGMDVHGPTPQGLFLKQLGIESRVGALMQANPDKAEQIGASAMRIAGPNEMGMRFKAICLSSPDSPPPTGFEQLVSDPE